MALTRQIAGAEPSRADARGPGWRGAMLGLATVIVPPTLLLAVLVAIFALTPITCDGESAWVLTVVCVVGIASCLLVFLLANAQNRRYDRPDRADDPSVARAQFVAAMGRMMSALSALVILMMAVATMILSPCVR